MRRMRVLFGSALGLLALGTGCATSTGGTGFSAFSSGPQAERLSREQQIAWRDSTYAQAIADQEGPGASIRAHFYNLAGSRRVRAVFSLDADAYVVIGHIDADGVLRMVYPVDPSKEDGFIKGNRSYQTQDFFAGFGAQYAFRAREVYYRGGGMSRMDSYDAGTGYLFIIASWRPMRFDRFSTGDEWDSFEVADEQYMRDPRPAIHELAALLAGENREAYTVKFARYINSQNMYPGSAGMASAFGSFRYCYGYGMGFAYDPTNDFSMFSPMARGSFGYGYSGDYFQNFTRRGVAYRYDALAGCYRTYNASSYGQYGYRIATDPGVGTPTVRKRGFDPEGLRTPFTPQNIGTRMAPVGRAADAGSTGSLPAASYRQRAVVEDAGVPGRREPRTEGRNVAERTRPTIQEMVNRRPVAPQEQSRATAGYSNRQGVDRSSYTPADRRTSNPRNVETARAPASGGGFERASGSTGSSSGGSSAPPVSAPASSSQGSGPASSGSSTGGRPPGGTP